MFLLFFSSLFVALPVVTQTEKMTTIRGRLKYHVCKRLFVFSLLFLSSFYCAP